MDLSPDVNGCNCHVTIDNGRGILIGSFEMKQIQQSSASATIHVELYER